MRITETEKAKNRALIVTTASRLFREKGLNNVSIADLMREAGFTHGGFYNHFASKEALVAAVCETALADSNTIFAGAMSGDDIDLAWRRHVDAYLSPHHRDSPETGCTMSALIGDMAHELCDVQSSVLCGAEGALHLMADYFARRYRLDKPAARRRAIEAWTQMLGALSLSRALVKADRVVADEILEVCRQKLTK